MKSDLGLSKEVGDLLVVSITGRTRLYIAEVISSNPLELKVEDAQGSPFRRLRQGGDFIILFLESLKVQGDDATSTAFLRQAVQNRAPLVSGLSRLGARDGKLCEILPAE